VNIIPCVLSLGVALAVALTGNSLPFLDQGHPPAVQCAQIVVGTLVTPWSCRNLPVRPHCDPPWTFAMVADGVWECAGSPGPVVLPSSPPVPAATATPRG
jgi:hypothetical protein